MCGLYACKVMLYSIANGGTCCLHVSSETLFDGDFKMLMWWGGGDDKKCLVVCLPLMGTVVGVLGCV